MVPDKQQVKLSRRRFIFVGAFGASLLGTAGAWHRWRALGNMRHKPKLDPQSGNDPHVGTTLALFLGGAFGVVLSGDDQADLEARLQYAAARDAGWREEYRWMAAYLDAESAETGSVNFVAATPETRDRIMRVVFAEGENLRTQQIRAFFRLNGMNLLRMRRSTIPQLTRLYRYSGVPWRQRGYSRWRGLPNDRLAYTRPLEGGRKC